MNFYVLIKSIHMATAAVTICCFIYRGLHKLANEQYKAQGWLRYFPHLNDTVLLSCAVYLACQSRQYPLNSDWLTAKVVALLVYIGMGMIVMRFGKNRMQRLLAFGIAIISFSYIVLAAFSRSPFPFSLFPLTNCYTSGLILRALIILR